METPVEKKKIETMPLPTILDEQEAQNSDNRVRTEILVVRLKEAMVLIKELFTLINELKVGVVADRAAANADAEAARQAGLQAAEMAAATAKEAIAEVRKIAEEARNTANLIGSSLMTYADGMTNVAAAQQGTSKGLMTNLMTRFEFKK